MWDGPEVRRECCERRSVRGARGAGAGRMRSSPGPAGVRTIAAVISALVRTESQMLPCAGERRGSTDSHVRATAWQLPYQAGGRGVPQFGHVSVESIGGVVEVAFCPGPCEDGGAQHETAVASKG